MTRRQTTLRIFLSISLSALSIHCSRAIQFEDGASNAGGTVGGNPKLTYYPSLTDSPEIEWDAPANNVQNYEVRFGSQPNLGDLLEWNPVGTGRSYQHTGLNLLDGGVYYYSVRAKTTDAQTLAVLTNESWKAVQCPTSYEFVPALSGYTDRGFCVAKYEAKQSGGAGVSQVSGFPWVNITRNAARIACQTNGAAFDLLTNLEWQTLARNIEMVAENWDQGTVGSVGGLNRGHSDGVPNQSLAASTDDNQSCSDTGQTCSLAIWSDQRRTHKLADGSILWDIGGNVREWLQDDNSTVRGKNEMISLVTNVAPFLLSAKNEFGPAGNYSSLNSGNFGGFGEAHINFASGGLNRGGSWAAGINAGVFAASLANQIDNSLSALGFRCVYRP